MLLRNVKVIVQQLFEFFLLKLFDTDMAERQRQLGYFGEEKNYKRLFYSTSLVEHFICFY